LFDGETMQTNQISRCTGFLLCTCLCFAPQKIGFAQDEASNPDSFVIRSVRVFDGKQVIPNDDVWVERGKIKEVGQQLAAPKDIKEIDGTGRTLLPGLIDAHTHAFGKALQSALIFGVTTELDMFSNIEESRIVKQELTAGKHPDMADLRTAGIMATAPGGHGTEYGFSIPTVSKSEEASAFVHARILEGSDYIKIIYDDGKALGLNFPMLSKETLRALIAAAHQHEKLAVVHIGTLPQAIDAIEAGADGLAHLFPTEPPSREFITLVAEHHAFVVPTLTVLETAANVPGGETLNKDARLAPYLSPEDSANLRKTFPRVVKTVSEKHAEETVRQLIAAKVPVLAGTDVPNPGTAHGASMHRELELLVRSGMTPTEALSAATFAPAVAFHLDDRGEIAAGKRADLLLVEGDPSQDITATRDIVAVWKQGTVVDRKAYAGKIAELRTESKPSQPEKLGADNEPLAISDFEEGKPTAKFGAGWTVSTDSIMGGKSTCEMKCVTGGLGQSQHVLEVTGEIDGGLPFAWAGVMFSPGDQQFAPRDVSAKKKLEFSAQGTGETFRVMIFTESGGRIPAVQTFTAPKEWKTFSFALTDFNGTDGHDLAAILFVGGPTAGKFSFQIDDVMLK
jgi:imidazolonepropionase-like amidohydrolase